MQDQTEQMFRSTTWKNPTPHTLDFKLFQGPKQVRRIKVNPGGKVTLPSVYDQAIRTVKEGVVVAGLAPQLVPEGREEVPMHVALARAAALGDQERKLIANTGVTAGTQLLEVASSMQLQIDAQKKELEALKSGPSEVEALKAKLAALEAEKAQLEAMLTAPKAPEAKPAEEKSKQGGK